MTVLSGTNPKEPKDIKTAAGLWSGRLLVGVAFFFDHFFPNVSYI